MRFDRHDEDSVLGFRHSKLFTRNIPIIIDPSGDPRVISGPDGRSESRIWSDAIKSFYTDDLIYDIKIKKTICEKKIRHKTEL